MARRWGCTPGQALAEDELHWQYERLIAEVETDIRKREELARQAGA